MKPPQNARRQRSKWIALKTLVRLIYRALHFAFIADKQAWVDRQVIATRQLQQKILQTLKIPGLSPQCVSLDLPLAGWVGHSTCWVKWGETSILTDPIWSNRCSPVSFMGPSRLQAVPIQLDNFPAPSIVLISHNHFDHLDISTLRQLRRLHKKTQFFAPSGLGEWLTSRGVPTKSLALGETHQVRIGDCVTTLTCTPAIHYSQRGLWDRNRTMWSSWVGQMERGQKRKTFFFAGDTAYNGEIFKRIGKQFSIDLSFVPIGAYEPRIYLRSAHVDPTEAVKIHREIRSKLSIGCHHSTFMLSDPKLEHPVEELTRALQEVDISPSVFTTLEVGQVVNW